MSTIIQRSEVNLMKLQLLLKHERIYQRMAFEMRGTSLRWMKNDSTFGKTSGIYYKTQNERAL